MPRGLSPRDARKRLVADLTRPNTALEDLGAAMVFFGPLVVGLGLPLAAAWCAHRLGHGWPDALPLLLAIGTLIVGGYLGAVNAMLGGLARKSDRATLLAQVPLVPIAEIDRAPVDTLVFVEGRVATRGELVRGALTGREAVWIETTVTRVAPGPNGPRFAGLQNARDAVRFDIEDAHGASVRIEPEDGVLHGGRSLEQPDRASGEHGEGFDRALAHVGVTLGEREDAGIVERALRPGERVTVLGVVRRGEGYREGPRTTIGGDERDRLLVTTRTREEEIGEAAPKPSRWWWNVAGLIVLAIGLGLTVGIAMGRV